MGYRGNLIICESDLPSRGRNSRFPLTVREYDWSADILVRFDNVGKPRADKNVRAPIT